MFISLPSPPISHHRSTVIMNNDAELRPFLINSKKENVEYYLPPIQQVLTPHSSPSASEEEDEYTITKNTLRKTSIASLLNTEPVLKRGRPRQGGINKKRKSQEAQEFLPRATKGLRHFSKQVCDKVAEKGRTTYNEVADELAMDIQRLKEDENETTRKMIYDQKNIRRRVYDALNVLMAMNIISKDKKMIQWLGIPENYSKRKSQKELLKEIQRERERMEDRIRSLRLLRGIVNEKISKNVNIQKIVWRNQHKDFLVEKISFPFFIIQSPDSHLIQQQNSHSAVISFIHHSSDTTPHIIEDTDVLTHLSF